MGTFTCEVCQQELALEEQAFILEGACHQCELEELGFQCYPCGSQFNADKQGSCNDICEEN